MACDDEVIPSQQRIEEVGDDADLEELYATSAICCMSLAHVPATISWSQPSSLASEFLEDLRRER